FFLSENRMITYSALQACFKSQLADFELIFFDELDSTNLYLKNYAKSHLEPAVCITGNQTAGYGQRNRHWLSSHNSVTFSFLLPISAPPSSLDGLTQLIALKLVEILSDYTDEVLSIKWPNDIYIGSKKVGGILLEVPAFDEKSSWLIVGIGLNLKTEKSSEPSSLFDAVNAGLIQFNRLDPVSLSQFLCDLITNQKVLFESFHSALFREYQRNYQLVDYFSKDEPVIVYYNQQNLTGLYKGLNENGELQVLIDDTLKTYRSGSVSVRPLN
ncbi:biotin--[acetyl-CoA-carboxylase] ligase, partial [Thiomicrorhabdus sp. ZW0627]|uniref:biotin--[acetyl-CoA-carboxylase] ligase n=1 Tax=Thiomicrorhabdus sp. ZW0627 TaxID=3039774 RepID=UPI002437342F